MIPLIGTSKFILLAILMLFPKFSTAGTDLHWLWDDRCAKCHVSGANFIRDSIVLQNGELLSRESGVSVNQFIQTLRRLKQDDIEFYTNLLTRVAGGIILK